MGKFGRISPEDVPHHYPCTVDFLRVHDVSDLLGNYRIAMKVIDRIYGRDKKELFKYTDRDELYELISGLKRKNKRSCAPEKFNVLEEVLMNQYLQGHSFGPEFHRLRKEMIICYEGVLEVCLTDVEGQKKSVSLKKGYMIEVPEFMLHKCTFTEKINSARIIANTDSIQMFVDGADLYGEDVFEILRDRLKRRRTV